MPLNDIEKVQELKVQKLVNSLELIADPIEYFRKLAKKTGTIYSTNDAMAIQLYEDYDWMHNIAERALKEYREGERKDGETDCEYTKRYLLSFR